MPGTDPRELEKLARDTAGARLKGAPDAPVLAAAIASKIIAAGLVRLAPGQDPKLTVTAVCRGTISGILFIEGDLPAAAVEILKSMSHLSQEIHQDPSDMMTWAMEGLASVAGLLPHEYRTHMREAIEEHFMGTGEVFGKLCEKAARAAS